jgi:aryl-alcohol dehydrogenase-like predicted oxidoreductase
VKLTANAYLHFTDDLQICRTLNGMWQVSGAHGRIDPRRALPEMFAYHDAGLTTWDLADHYGPAEDFIGEFRHQLQTQRGAAAAGTMHAFTKWVPRPMPMTRQRVQAAIDVSRRRMAAEVLDLVQFHWWDYADDNYLIALNELARLRDGGVIKHLALTNFDTEHLRIVTEHGIRIVSNQVQYSLIDRRPERAMVPYCAHERIWLLAYGTLCGGLLSDRFAGAGEPGPSDLNTASLRKYKQMIDAWGGWSLFQELLRVLKRIAAQYDVSIANVAVRYILDKPQVAGAIVGARLGVAQHIADTKRMFDVQLNATDLDGIHAVTARARDLHMMIGDCGAEYRN